MTLNKASCINLIQKVGHDIACQEDRDNDSLRYTSQREGGQAGIMLPMRSTESMIIDK